MHFTYLINRGDKKPCHVQNIYNNRQLQLKSTLLKKLWFAIYLPISRKQDYLKSTECTFIFNKKYEKKTELSTILAVCAMMPIEKLLGKQLRLSKIPNSRKQQ